MRAQTKKRLAAFGRRWSLAVGAVLCLLVVPLWRVAAQVIIDGPVAGIDIRAMEEGAKPAAEEGEGEKDPEALFPQSALLKTDPDIDRLMRRARELTDDQRYEVSATLWQQVLDRSGSELTTHPDWVNKRDDETNDRQWLQTYKSVRTEVERLLAALPSEGLNQYRIVSDGPARTLLAGAQGEKEEASLDEIVRRYFVSSVGDDAAYRLGCLLLDRYDFTGAARLFDKILSIHPDPTMSREDVMLRLAVCQARMGDRISAELTYGELERAVKARPSAVSAEAFQLVGADVQKKHQLVADNYRASGDWPMALGTAARDGHMAALPADTLQGNLHESWSYRVDVFENDAYRAAMAPGDSASREANMVARRRIMMDPYGNEMAVPPQPSRDLLIQSWKENSWTPTSQAILVGGKIIFRTPTRLAAFDATAVGEPRLLWMAPPDGSLTADGKDFDPENVDRLKSESVEWTRIATMMGTARPDRPSDYRGVWLFGDRVPQSMAQANNTVYMIDDMPQMRPDSDPKVALCAWGAMGVETPKSGATRAKLMAIDATTGKILWEWPGDDVLEKPADRPAATPAATTPALVPGGPVALPAPAAPGRPAEATNDDFRFLGPPVPHRRTLLVPVYSGGGLWVYALETTEGKNAQGKRTQSRKIAWKTSLCDDPQSGGDRWAPVGMCLDGGDLFVATGRGVLFALDATSGSVRWAVRYNRTMSQSRGGYNRFGGGQQTMVSFNGWDENYVIARGPWVILMASDYKNLVALNRGTGDFAWPAVGVEDVNYVLGVAGDDLYVAGPKSIRAYSLRKEGAIDWSVDLDEPSHGRGALTADGLYIPVKDTIHRYSLKGELQGKANVHFARDRDDPVGNLFTDGQTLFAAGPERIYALTNAEQQLKRLDAQISAGDAALRRRRMMLRSRADMLAGAVDDLRAVQGDLLKSEGTVAALSFVLAGLDEMELPRRSPLVALDALVGKDGVLSRLSDGDREELSSRQRNRISTALATSLERIADKPAPEALALVLQSMSAWPDDSLRTISDLALRANARAESADLMRESLKSTSPRRRAAAATALGVALGAKAADEMAALLPDANEEVRTAAARALVELGDRRALAPLVALLDSNSVATRHEANRLLSASTGEESAFIAYAEPKDRAASVEKWRTWLASKGESAKLRVPLDFRKHRGNRILVTDFEAGTLHEMDSKGNVLWSSPKVPGAWGCQGLPNGHRLVASFQQLYVVEFDAQGTEVWRSQGKLPIYPATVLRLDNGNTLVAGRDLADKEGVVLEIGRDGKPIDNTRINLAFKPYDLRLLANGRMLAACTYDNLVCEFDRSGQRVDRATISGLARPESVRKLNDGHWLVVDNGGKTEMVNDKLRGVRRVVRQGRILEYDENLKLVNTRMNDTGEVRDAERLDNGNLLILDTEGIKEITSSGEQVWSKAATGGKRLSVY